MSFDDVNLLAKRYLREKLLNEDIPTVGKYKFPKISAVNYIPENPVLPFNYLKSTVTKEKYWYHCFTSEKNFNRLYTNFHEYKDILKQTKGIISADFNMYRDYPEKFLIENCRQNRTVDYLLQQEGIPMIPTAGFAGESSWEWCFDGLPLNSTVAVTTNTVRNHEDNRLFIGGMNVMIKKLQPTTIVVCGKCPEWISKKFPDIKVIQIPNYSQMWHSRGKK